MPTSEVIYQGELRCKATHLQSQSLIFTDAPTDNHGKGELFSPTDLMATSLGLCMITVMGIEANRLQVDIDGAKLSITKHMGVMPRRVVKVEIEMVVPDRGLTEEVKEALTRTGLNCPVARSLHPDLVQDVKISYVSEQ